MPPEKSAEPEPAKKGKGKKRKGGGMDVLPISDGPMKLEDCQCDECNEMRKMNLRFAGGCECYNKYYPKPNDPNVENPKPAPESEPAAEPEPEPEPETIEVQAQAPPAPPPPPAYDEYEADVNGTGITIRALNNTHTINQGNNERFDSGCETSDEVDRRVSYRSFMLLFIILITSPVEKDQRLPR